MSCERWRDAISARLDDEESGLDAALIDAHVARCPSCRTFAAAAEASRRERRVGSATGVPDLSRRVRTAVAAADRARQHAAVRGLLTAVAMLIIALSLRALVLGDEHDTGSHAARHLGAFSAAYGVGLLVLAVRPARARTMLPVAAVLAGALMITATVDLLQGRIPLVGEAQHIPEVLSVVLVWLLTGVPRRSQTAAAPHPALHAVGDERGSDVA